MAKQLIKGNEAVVRGAVAAGCKAFFGYPITPASEIAEVASLLFSRMTVPILYYLEKRWETTHLHHETGKEG